MTTREKFILGLAAVAAIGAGGYYAMTLSATPPASTQTVKTDYTALIASTQVNLKQGELTDREESILSAATTPWVRNPLRSRPLSAEESGSSSAIPMPKYMGFINTGPQPIAIIDGRDYRPGETIQGGEYKLTQFTQTILNCFAVAQPTPWKCHLKNRNLK
jgi:hypothetical protein